MMLKQHQSLPRDAVRGQRTSFSGLRAPAVSSRTAQKQSCIRQQVGRAECVRAAAFSSGSALHQQHPQRLARPPLHPRRAHHIVTQAASGNGADVRVPEGSVSVVLLAGGMGKRMGAAIPKQYLPLNGRALATYSLQTFSNMPEVGEVVIVCEPSWRDIFEKAISVSVPKDMPVKWALPGDERQDSVCNGLNEVTRDLVAVHDTARPLVTRNDAARCFKDGWQHGAAVLGVMVKPTIKEVDSTGMVVKTLERAKLWEVQTPQVIRTALLREGFEAVRTQKLAVTDDVSIVEAMGRPVKVTEGSYMNIKVTTPDDLPMAAAFLEELQKAAAS